ncbi:MAG: hypothetical protein KatS3mg102_0458 [Planctomycetota bacterium]|nr:MAG: hypothetical protein KatS3mg102_0458 [Planctomycetota bacterium]
MGLKRTRIDGLWFWNAYQPERGIDFNGWWWQHAAGGLLFDPMPLAGPELEQVRAGGGVRWILLTNASHLRAAPALKQAFGAALLAPAAERALFGEAAPQVDVWYESASELPAELRGELEPFPIRGGKTPCEFAFHLVPLRALLFGDIVRSERTGLLTLLGDDKLSDRGAVVQAVRQLASLRFEAVLIGDGDPIFCGAREAYLELLAGLAGSPAVP